MISHFLMPNLYIHNLSRFTGVEIPKFVDKTTPEYKPKFDALVRNGIQHVVLIYTQENY